MTRRKTAPLPLVIDDISVLETISNKKGTLKECFALMDSKKLSILKLIRTN